MISAISSSHAAGSICANRPGCAASASVQPSKRSMATRVMHGRPNILAALGPGELVTATPFQPRDLISLNEPALALALANWAAW